MCLRRRFRLHGCPTSHRALPQGQVCPVPPPSLNATWPKVGKTHLLFPNAGAKWLRIYDMRVSDPKAGMSSVLAHSKAVRGLSFDPFHDKRLSTFSEDGTRLKRSVIGGVFAALQMWCRGGQDMGPAQVAGSAVLIEHGKQKPTADRMVSHTQRRAGFDRQGGVRSQTVGSQRLSARPSQRFQHSAAGTQLQICSAIPQYAQRPSRPLSMIVPISLLSALPHFFPSSTLTSA